MNYLLLFLIAFPSSTALTLDANMRQATLSSTEDLTGLMCASMSTLDLGDRELARNHVRVELR